MATMRVHELAKEFGMTSKEMLEKLAEMKIPAKNHASALVDAYVDKVRKKLGPELEARAAQIEAEKRAAEEAAAAEAAAKKAAEEAARLAAEEERRARQEELARRAAEAEAARRAAEEEAAARAAAEEAARKEAELNAKRLKTPSAFGSLLDQIAAENSRMEEEKAAAAEAKAAAKAAREAEKKAKETAKKETAAKTKVDTNQTAAMPDPAKADSRRNKKGKKGRNAEVVEDRYSQMAAAAEKLERESVMAQARAQFGIATPTEEEGGRRKKRKEKRAAEKAAKEAAAAAAKAEATGVPVGCVQVVSGITVGELAEALEVPGNEIIKRLFMLGTMLTLTQTMSDDLVELIADDLGREVKVISQEEEMSFTFHDDPDALLPRPPVVTVMGHVDHGKTSLLDAIRETGVAAREAGGITQHIGASVVYINGQQITFVDTPGHEAFTAMRARGAKVTDVVILVVAADDGVMPQTVEAINHSKAAGVPIVVAINKMDKEGANPERVKSELAERGVIPEEWGGTNMFVEVSARARTGIDDLLETVILQADVLELKANPNTTASGFVIEANLDKGRGSVATVIVQRGTLHVGDALVAGTSYGRVRALVDPKGNKVKAAGPSDPVEILGLNSVPSAGDEFCVFEDESEARKLAESRAMKQRLAAQEAAGHVSLDDLFARIEQDKLAELNLIVKADVQGSIEALRDALNKMDQSEVRINIVHAAVGGITETDVTLAAASNAIIIGFGVRPQTKAKVAAEHEKVDIRTYSVIYQAIDEINAARVGLLAPEEVVVETGAAEVRDTFKVPKAGTIAGCLVTEGEIARSDQIRVVRDGVIVHDGKVSSMRHYKDDVNTVRAGYECGIGIENFQDIKPGDVLEGYRIDQVERKA